MAKKIVVVNAGPRKGWNTDTLITEAAKGAESAGAVIERFDLFRLEPQAAVPSEITGFNIICKSRKPSAESL